MIVQIPHVAARRKRGREQSRDGVFGCRLACAASYTHHSSAPSFACFPTERLQGHGGIRHTQLRTVRIDFMIDNGQFRAPFEYAADKIVTVVRGSAQREETIAL